ncbi:MAG: hypothetical protein FWG18_03845, partial [Alphaproteobacteria bacterium]|nr:hypothetical protein [Alphaproteobacteria bacterium]
MNNWLSAFVESNIQCWSCGVFDRLFQVISAAAAAIYGKMTIVAVLIFIIFVAFYILYAVWKNI